MTELWITEFQSDKVDEFIYNAYQNDKVIFKVNFTDVPIRQVTELIPILEKYRILSKTKLIKTIVYVETRVEKWIAKALIKIAKPERPVEFKIKSYKKSGEYAP